MFGETHMFRVYRVCIDGVSAAANCAARRARVCIGGAGCCNCARRAAAALTRRWKHFQKRPKNIPKTSKKPSAAFDTTVSLKEYMLFVSRYTNVTSFLPNGHRKCSENLFKIQLPPRFELGSLDSKSRVLTITPWELIVRHKWSLFTSHSNQWKAPCQPGDVTTQQTQHSYRAVRHSTWTKPIKVKGEKKRPEVSSIEIDYLLRPSACELNLFHHLAQTLTKGHTGPAEIWTRIAGFRVLSANRYTTGPEIHQWGN